MHTQTQEPEQHSRRPWSPLCVTLSAPDPTVERLARESDYIARQSRRDSVPLPDFKRRRGHK